MNDDVRILIASDAVGDAEAVRSILSEQYQSIFTTTEQSQAVEEFDAVRPAFLILAFDQIEKAERYYLHLYRTSKEIQTLQHKTILLCAKERVEHAYRLCKEKQFDEYVVYWPLTYDHLRIFMAMDHLIADLQKSDTNTVSEDVLTKVRTLGTIVPAMESSLKSAETMIAKTADSVDGAAAEISAALLGMCDRLLKDGLSGALEVRDGAHVRSEFNRLQATQVLPKIDGMKQQIQSAKRDTEELIRNTQPKLEQMKTLNKTARTFTPQILLVDDDGFQSKLLSPVFVNEDIKLSYAASAARALSMLSKMSPSLILMDVHLPDVDGIQLTRKIKAMPRFREVPVIMITGSSEKRIVVESLKAGAVDFVVKPIDKEVLLGKIKKLLNLD